MESQNSANINLALAKMPDRIGDTNYEINGGNVTRKCPFKPCNKAGCRKFWHKPCTAYSPGLVRQLWPMVLLVGILEIFFGVVLLAFLTTYRHTYDKIYGTDGSKIISLSSIIGLATLMLCGMMLIISMVRDNRKIMWIRIVTSTTLSGYVVILSVLKMHFALLVIEKVPSVAANNAFILSDACVLEVFTLLAAVIHFFCDVAVFTYYNLRYLHPTLFYTGQVEHF